MKYRKGILVEDATEKELLRWQMEKIVKESDDMSNRSLGECSYALAKLHESLENRNRRTLFGIVVLFNCFICTLIFIVQLFWRER